MFSMDVRFGASIESISKLCIDEKELARAFPSWSSANRVVGRETTTRISSSRIDGFRRRNISVSTREVFVSLLRMTALSKRGRAGVGYKVEDS